MKLSSSVLFVGKYFRLSRSQDVYLNFTPTGYAVTRYVESDSNGLWKDVDLIKLKILEPEEYNEIMADLDRFLEKQDRLPFQEPNQSLTQWGV